MKYKYIFFDLDGTLTDPKEGIINCVKYALESFGIYETDNEKLMRCIGPPLIYSFTNFFGFSDADAKKAVEKYRERFAVKGIFENGVYDGIYDLLQKLTDNGHILAVATSKPKIFADRIMARYRLRPYFKLISGAELDGTRDNKNEVIDYAIDKLGCKRDKIIMVGDRKHDIIGAKQCKIASCGVRFGYAEPGELEEAGADYIAEDMGDLFKILSQR